MNGLAKKAILLFVVSALLTPIGDYFHITSKITSYDVPFAVGVAKTPWWFMLLVGLFSITLGLFMRFSIKKWNLTRPVQGDFTTVVQVVVLVKCMYLLSTILPKNPPKLDSWLLLFLALLCWSLFDKTKLGFSIAFVAGFLGLLGEFFTAKLGLMHYSKELVWFLGAPPWTLLIYFSFAIAVFVLEDYLHRRYCKQTASVEQPI